MKLDRPIVFFDIESTGLDVATDRMVELAAVKLVPVAAASSVHQGEGEEAALPVSGPHLTPALSPRGEGVDAGAGAGDRISNRRRWLFNPGRLMTREVIECHGITDETVRLEPRFTERMEDYRRRIEAEPLMMAVASKGQRVSSSNEAEHRRLLGLLDNVRHLDGQARLADEVFAFFKGCDLGGFNITGFDIPLLWEELFRAGHELDLNLARVIDASQIFRKKEQRTLSAALKFYCGKEHSRAHSGEGDVEATIEVLEGQMARYEDLRAMDTLALSRWARPDDRIDLDGRIVRDEEGRAVYGFGKSKGTPVFEDPGFGQWMLKQPFITEQTKRVVRGILGRKT